MGKSATIRDKGKPVVDDCYYDLFLLAANKQSNELKKTQVVTSKQAGTYT